MSLQPGSQENRNMKHDHVTVTRDTENLKPQTRSCHYNQGHRNHETSNTLMSLSCNQGHRKPQITNIKHAHVTVTRVTENMKHQTRSCHFHVTRDTENLKYQTRSCHCNQGHRKPSNIKHVHVTVTRDTENLKHQTRSCHCNQGHRKPETSRSCHCNQVKSSKYTFITPHRAVQLTTKGSLII